MHEIFQRTGRTPDEILSKPEGVQKFVLLSMEERLKQEYEEKQSIIKMFGRG